MNPLLAIVLLFYYWIRGILLFFVPKSLRLKSVKDEIVLITGGGSGLGRALALRFAEKGAAIVVWDINKAGLDETVAVIKKATGVDVKAYVCDITDRQAVYDTAAQVRRDVGVVSILVNNAGVVNGKKFLQTSDEKILQTMNVNVISHFWTTKAFLPDMIVKNHGHLVTIASVAGQTGCVQLADYCASKHAAFGFEESIRLELRAEGVDGVKSTLVAPFFMNTGMFQGFKSSVIPPLEPEDAADEIMLAVLTDQEILAIPKLFYTLNTLKTLLPTKANYILYEALGGYEAMTSFTGRQTHNNTNANNNNNNNFKKK